jgi:hypothetical protein
VSGLLLNRATQACSKPATKKSLYNKYICSDSTKRFYGKTTCNNHQISTLNKVIYFFLIQNPRYIYPHTLVVFDLTTHCSNLRRQRRYHYIHKPPGRVVRFIATILQGQKNLQNVPYRWFKPRVSGDLENQAPTSMVQLWHPRNHRNLLILN